MTVKFLQEAGIRNPSGGGIIFVDISTTPGGMATGIGLSISPDGPVEIAGYTFTFVAPADLPANSGKLKIILDEDVQLPEVAEEPTEQQPSADLSVIRSTIPQSVKAGDIFDYELKVVNLGPSDAANVVLVEDLSSEADLASITPAWGSCREVRGLLECQFTPAPPPLLLAPVRLSKANLSADSAPVVLVRLPFWVGWLIWCLCWHRWH